MADERIAEAITSACSAIDGDLIAHLALELSSRPSTAGSERPLAEWLVQWIAERSDIELRLQPIDESRANVLAGQDHPVLALYGHLDTSLHGDASIDARIRGDATPIAGPEIVDGFVWGHGLAVSKGPLAAATVALIETHRVLRGLGRGEEIGAMFLAGGTHRAIPPWPTSSTGGTHGEMAIGLRTALRAGYRPGAVLNVKSGPREPLYEEPGLLYLSVTVPGRWGSGASSAEPERFVGAPARVVEVVRSLEVWRRAFLAAREGRGGQAGAEVVLGAIESGLPAKVDFLPAFGRALLSVVSLPEDDHESIAAELAAHLRDDPELKDFAAEIAVEAYGSLPAGRTDPAHPLAVLVTETWARRYGLVPGDPYKGPTDGALFRAEGIPTIRAGAPSRYHPDDRRREGFVIDDLVSIAQLWSEVAIAYCCRS